MAKTFDLKDDSVVVVVGSGAGGGTLANELAQKGVDVVCLEAGPRLSLSDIVNDNDTMFGRLSWLDKRIGTGELNPGLPLWVCKTVGGTTVHWAGAALRFQEHEFKTRTIYGEIKGANMMDWPISLQELEPFYDRPRTSWASPAPTASRGCPATTTTRCWRRAPSASATRNSTPATWRSTPSRGTAGRRAIRSASAWPAAPSARNGRRSIPRFRRRRAPGGSSFGPRAWCCRSPTTPAAWSLA